METARTLVRRGATLFLMVRVYVLLVAMRGIIRANSLERITARLGTPMQETPQDGLVDEQLHYARRVGWAISRVAPMTPTDSNCYPQALTAFWLLRRRHIPTTFYYGAAFDEDGTALQAHVWIRSGSVVVTGGRPHRRFGPLSWYAS